MVAYVQRENEYLDIFKDIFVELGFFKNQSINASALTDLKVIDSSPKNSDEKTKALEQTYLHNLDDLDPWVRQDAVENLLKLEMREKRNYPLSVDMKSSGILIGDVFPQHSTLKKSTTSSVVMALEKNLKAEDSVIRQLAAETLLHLKEHDEEKILLTLAENINSNTPWLQRRGIKQLSQLEGDHALKRELLSKALSHSDVETRQIAAETLFKLKKDDLSLISTFIVNLSAENPEVVVKAAQHLHMLSINNSQTIEILVRSLHHTNFNTSQTIADILINLNQAHDQVKECLIANISAPELAIRNRALEQLKRLGYLLAPNVVDAYVRNLKHPDILIRQEAIAILIALKKTNHQLLQLLLEQVGNENTALATNAKNLLAALGKNDDQVIMFLIKVLEDKTGKYFPQAFNMLQFILDIPINADNNNPPAFQVETGGFFPGVHLIIKTIGIAVQTTNSLFAETTLIRALLKNSFSGARWLVHNSASFSDIDNQGNTALHRAAATGQIFIAQLLLNKDDTAIKKANLQGATALHTAASNGQLAMMQWLLQNGASIKEADKHGRTALIYAANSHHLPVIQWLLQNGASLKEMNQYGDTVLLLIISQNFNPGFVELLLKNGASFKEMDKEGTTVLLRAALWGIPAAVMWVLNKLAADPINKKQDCAGFYRAAWQGNLDAVRHYLANGMKQFTVRQQPGSTAVLLAAAAGHLDIVQCLLNSIVQEKEKRSNQDAALLWASAHGRLPVVTWLVKEAKASLANQTIYGDTPLLISAFRGHFTTAQFLLTQGADITVKNKFGCDAIALARISNFLPLVGLLQSYTMSDKITAPVKLTNNDTIIDQKTVIIPTLSPSLSSSPSKKFLNIFLELLDHKEAEIQRGAAFILAEIQINNSLVFNIISESLQHTDGAIRDYAFQLLKKQQKLYLPEIITIFRQMLHHKKVNIRQEALEVLMDLNQIDVSVALSILQQNLSAPETAIAVRVIRQLWQLAGVQPQALALLQKILRDPNSKPEMQQFAAITLISLEKFDESMLQIILQNLSCNNQWLRQNATDLLTRLGKISTEPVIKVYQQNVNHKNIEISQEAIQVLINLKRYGEQELRALISHLEGNTRTNFIAKNLLVALAKTDYTVLTLLMDMLTKDVEHKLCKNIIETFKEIMMIAGTFASNTTTLQRSIHQGQLPLSKWFLENGAVIKNMDAKTHAALMGAAKQGHLAAMQAFANQSYPLLDTKIDHKLEQPTLPQHPPKIFFTLLEDKEIAIRQGAAIILAQLQIDTPSVMKVLLDTLSDDNNSTQEEAFDVLEQLGKIDTQDVISKLTQNLQHSNAGVRQFAVEKLLKLEAIKISLAVKILIKNLAATDPNIHKAAIQQLDELEKADAPEVIAAHKENLFHKNEEIRQEAAEALIELNTADEQVLRVLQTNASIGNSALQPRAIQLLNALEKSNNETLTDIFQKLHIFKPTFNAGRINKKITLSAKMKPASVTAKQRIGSSFDVALSLIQDYLFFAPAALNNNFQLMDHKTIDSNKPEDDKTNTAASEPPNLSTGQSHKNFDHCL